MLFTRAKLFPNRIAISDASGNYTYTQLANDSDSLATLLLQHKSDLKEERIALLIPSSYHYVVAQWAIWKAGGIAVPLCISHPPTEWEYVLRDTQCKRILTHPSFHSKIQGLAERLDLYSISIDTPFHTQAPLKLPRLSLTRRAMIIYTSGSTGKPKGVVTTHANIKAQIQALVQAWEWSQEDYIVNILPLHHVHGIINVLSCALWSGARCLMIPRFKAPEIWDLFCKEPLTLFMAVPTIYHKLIGHFEQASSQQQMFMKLGFQKMRLMVSGSAALPVKVLKKWHQITGHILLERYGMTEIGMALSNAYRTERFPGHVGQPLPNVATRIVNEIGEPCPIDEAGELLIKGPSVFLEYWNKPQATQKAFKEGWFITGDIVQKNTEGIYRIVGRKSVDIIKTGGYKVSALEIQEVLREHPSIKECAVVGVPDEEWGQIVAVAIILHPQTALNIDMLKEWGQERLAKYKIPTQMIVLARLPRNTMGKVVKPRIVKLFTSV